MEGYVDPDKALGHEFTPKTVAYDEKDLCLYALGIGAGRDPLDTDDLKFVYELNRAGFHALPTYAVTFPFAVMWQISDTPGLKFNPMLLLHGEQYLELKKPLPTKATLTHSARISQIYDKGSGALVLVDIHSRDENGEEIAYNQASIFLRGIGGFGGERGPSSRINLPPERPPDVIHEEQIRPDQALLYRLAGNDPNPLHADPQFAAMGGFDRPILHGLCTLGFVTRAVLKHCAGNDPARFHSLKTRFTGHVFPGETLVTEMWQTSDTEVIVQSKVKERDVVVLSNTAVTFHE
ncbi:MAG: MaoC/PaaZ C-terminal domain-containing protein [Anaerolineae bacterium]